MYHKHHTEALVLKSVAESTDNKRLVLLTRDLGVVFAHVKSGRTGASKLKAGIQEYSFGEYSLLHGKIGWRCVSVRTEGNYFEILKTSKEKVVSKTRVLNLLQALVTGEEPNKKIFEDVMSFLEFLNVFEGGELDLLEALVIARVLFELGFLRHEAKFEYLFGSSQIDTDILNKVAPDKKDLIKIINEALRAAEVKT